MGISRWKDMNQINDCGERAANRYEELEYWTVNWRKRGGLNECTRFQKKNHFISKNIVCVYS